MLEHIFEIEFRFEMADGNNKATVRKNYCNKFFACIVFRLMLSDTAAGLFFFVRLRVGGICAHSFCCRATACLFAIRFYFVASSFFSFTIHTVSDSGTSWNSSQQYNRYKSLHSTAHTQPWEGAHVYFTLITINRNRTNEKKTETRRNEQTHFKFLSLILLTDKKHDFSATESSGTLYSWSLTCFCEKHFAIKTWENLAQTLAPQMEKILSFCFVSLISASHMMNSPVNQINIECARQHLKLHGWWMSLIIQ